MIDRYNNALLRALSPEQLLLLEPHFEICRLKLNEVICAENVPTETVDFVETGLISVIAGERTPTGRIEVGIIGADGYTGTPLVLGSLTSPFMYLVQRPAVTLRIPAVALRNACERSRELEHVLMRYAHSFMVQLAETARANARFTVEQRLSRWLLIAHDHTDGDEIAMTHEFLSMMLGVRRPGVTVATHILEGDRLIKAKRGSIRILDREGLEAYAAGSYGLARAEHVRLFPRGAATAPRVNYELS